MANELHFSNISDRLPPQNIEAEEAILGGILLDPEAISRVAELLNPENFSITAHQIIYQATLTLHSQGKPTDLMTVTTWLGDHELLEKVGGQLKLAQLVDRTVSAVNIDQYGLLVIDKSVRRRLIQAGHEIIDLGYETATPLEKVLDQAEQKVFNITQIRPQQNLVPIGETIINIFQDIEDRNEGIVLPGIPCGFYDLDAMTGGFQRSDLIIVAGRPAMGKTALCTNIAYNIAKGQKLPIAIFSLEMSKEQLVQRLLASEAKIESNRLRSGRISQSEWEPLMQAISSLSEVPVFIDDTPNITVTEMRSKTRRLQAENGGAIGLVLIDYLQLMEGTTSDNRVQELSRITRSLKGLARELSVPVIALSQLSRGVEARTNKRPMMSDLRESGCLAGETLITLADTGARVTIKDLVGKTGFAVWALNESIMQLEKALVSKVFCTGIKPVFTLTTRLGRKIRATGNHKFLTIDGWRRLDELNVKQHLCLPRYLPSSDKQQTMTYAETALLGHLIGDGCTLPRHAIQYTTREIDLAENVAFLAKEVFGESINPKIKAERTWYQVYLSVTQRLTHNVRNPVAKWLDNSIGMTTRELQAQMGTSFCGSTLYKANLSRERTLKVANIAQSNQMMILAKSDVYWDEIISIEPDGETEVYDLTVPQLHNFIANNIVVHNSIEQDADIVIMIYRDDYYNPDTPDRGITEVIVAKHRNGPTGTVKLLFDPQFTKFRNLANPRSS